MANVQIAVRLRGKPGPHTAVVFAGFQVFDNGVANKVGRARRLRAWRWISFRTGVRISHISILSGFPNQRFSPPCFSFHLPYESADFIYPTIQLPIYQVSRCWQFPTILGFRSPESFCLPSPLLPQLAFQKTYTIQPR